MAANVDPNKSTMASTSEKIPSEEELPVVEVFKTSDGVVLKWGEGGAQQTTAGVDASYITDSFHAIDSNGDEPFRKTFGTLLHFHNGVLTIGETRYRIRVDTHPKQQPDAAASDRWIFPITGVEIRGSYSRPTDQPSVWIGRDSARTAVREVAERNYKMRHSTDHAQFSFLVASGHVRSGKTRTGIETPFIVQDYCTESVTNSSVPVYLKVDFLHGSMFNNNFDRPDLSADEALGARLMVAFYKTLELKKISSADALKHIVSVVHRTFGEDKIVPIIIHFDEHGAFIKSKDQGGKEYFLQMLQCIGSVATCGDNGGTFFIVPITTGTSHSDANFDQLSRYTIKPVPLPTLNDAHAMDLAWQCIELLNDVKKDVIQRILSTDTFLIALGDTGGLPGLIFFLCTGAIGKEHVVRLHSATSMYMTGDWSERWNLLVPAFLARVPVSGSTVLGQIDGANYTVQKSLDSGSVFLRNIGENRELGLAPAFLAKFNSIESKQFMNGLLLKSVTLSDGWTWQLFENAHLLYLSAVMNALIICQDMFLGTVNLGILLRHAQPEASPHLGLAIALPPLFAASSYFKEEAQCIPRSNATRNRSHGVSLEDQSQIFKAADGTPIIDGYLNLNLGRPAVSTTLFLQYKHSNLDNASSAVNVSTMNSEVKKLGARLRKHGWLIEKPWIFLWVTNRTVIQNESPDSRLLWIGKDDLFCHAPLLGNRGLVPQETSRADE